MKDFENYLSPLSTIEKIEVPDVIFDKIQSKIANEIIPDKTIWLYGIASGLLILFSFSFVVNDTSKDMKNQNVSLSMDSSSINFLNY